MYHIFCIYSSVEGHLDSFQPLAIINKAHMNIVGYVSLLHVRAFSGYMPRRGIAGSSGSTMSNFLRNCWIDFQSGCTSVQSHQQWGTELKREFSTEETEMALKHLKECSTSFVIRKMQMKTTLIPPHTS